VKKRVKQKKADIQLRIRRRRRMAAKVETQRAALASTSGRLEEGAIAPYGQRGRVPTTLEAALINLDSVARAIIVARVRSEKER
jgi:hypothetical protein